MSPAASALVRLVIVDDHPLVREGLRARLSVAGGLEAIGEAASGAEALELGERLLPDLMLLDVGMRGINGIEVAGLLRERQPSIRILMLSMYDNREYVLSAIRAGARGYVLKEAPTEHIIAAIHAVMAGGSYFSSGISSLIAQASATTPQLTSREHEVLVLVAQGGSNKRIARELDISVRTVETHRLSLRRKLGVESATELLKVAVNHGWITL